MLNLHILFLLRSLLTIMFLCNGLLCDLTYHRDEEVCKLKQGHGSTMMEVEGQVKTSKQELSRKDNELYELRVSLV